MLDGAPFARAELGLGETRCDPNWWCGGHPGDMGDPEEG